MGITITKLEEPSRIEFTTTSDLVGSGNCVLISQGSQTFIGITWHVQTAKPWMNRFAAVLTPIIIAGHNRLMRGGEAGLNRWIARRHAQ